MNRCSKISASICDCGLPEIVFVAVKTGECSLIILFDNGNQPNVFGNSCPGQFDPVLVNNGIKLVRVIAFAG